jgi:hypothetical protein
MQETLDSIAGQRHGNTVVGTPSRRTGRDAQVSSNRTLKRRSDAAVGRDTGALHYCETQEHDITLLHGSGNVATEVGSTGQQSCGTYVGSACNFNNEEATRSGGTVLQNSPTSIENHVHVGCTEEPHVSPLHANETWTAQGEYSLAEIAPTNLGTLPNHVLSPSVSSSYNLEDGIFEPGSAYQNLFQSLRSHVFRTAQAENVELDKRYALASGWNVSAGIHSDTFAHRLPETAGDTAGSGNVEGTETFELPPAQEYLLWKAWTEEVSIWVCEGEASHYFATIADGHKA